MSEPLEERLCPWLLPKLDEWRAAADRGRLGHGWLIAGPPGVGKLNLARLLACRLTTGRGFEEAPPVLTAADAVAAYGRRAEVADHHADLHLVFPEEGKSSIAVEQIRAVTEALGLKSHAGHAKAVVIDPADAMTPAASNALLKTLEEPTGGTYLFLVTDRPGRLLATIRSRCQTVMISRPPATVAQPWLAANDAASDDSALRVGPILKAVRAADDKSINFMELEESINLIYENKIDPQSVAEQWVKLDPEMALDWLIGRLQRMIRDRLLAEGTTSVTDNGPALSQNPANVLSLAKQFELLGDAERLRDRLGTGLNVELALKALLLGFLPDRRSQSRVDSQR